MINPPGLVIFDCDGVLVDSESLIVHGLGSVLARYGLQANLEELHALFRGVSFDGLQNAVLAQWGVRLPDDIVSLIEDAERVAVEGGLLAIPGVADAVRSIAASGTMVCVGSNASPRAIEQRLNLTGLYHLFEGRLFSGGMVPRRKPYPDVFIHAAETLGFSPEECAVIEDSDSGVQAGLAAGMRVLAYVASPTCDVADSMAVVRFTDMASLPVLLGVNTGGPTE